MTHRRKIAENVYVTRVLPFTFELRTYHGVSRRRNYLDHFCRLCGEKPGSHRPNMQVLMAIEKTLEAVYKRMGIDIGTVSRTGPGQQLEPGQQVPELADMNVAGTDATVRKVLSYNTRALSWNADWTRNAEEKYCYCGTNKQEPCVTCAMCKNWFHHSCTKAVPAEGDGYLPYQLDCKFGVT